MFSSFCKLGCFTMEGLAEEELSNGVFDEGGNLEGAAMTVFYPCCLIPE